MPGTAAAQQGVWGGWLSKKPFQKELAMHGLTFDPGQRRVLLLVKTKLTWKLFTKVIKEPSEEAWVGQTLSNKKRSANTLIQRVGREYLLRSKY